MTNANEIFEQIVNDPAHCIFELSGQVGCGKTETAKEIGYLFCNAGKKVRMFERSEYLDVGFLEPRFTYTKARMNDLSTIIDMTTNDSDSVCIIDHFKLSSNEIEVLMEYASQRRNTIIITKQNDGDLAFKPMAC